MQEIWNRFINDDGAVQRVLSIVGLRNLDVSDEIKLSAARIIINELDYVDSVLCFKIDVNEALIRCNNRKKGFPQLLKNMNSKEVERSFKAANDMIPSIIELLSEKNIRVRIIDGGA